MVTQRSPLPKPTPALPNAVQQSRLSRAASIVAADRSVGGFCQPQMFALKDLPIAEIDEEPSSATQRRSPRSPRTPRTPRTPRGHVQRRTASQDLIERRNSMAQNLPPQCIGGLRLLVLSSEDLGSDMHAVVSSICADPGPGMPGTRQEYMRGKAVQRYFEGLLPHAEVSAEEFETHPALFFSWLRMAFLLGAVAVVLFVYTRHALIASSTVLYWPLALCLALVGVIVFVVVHTFFMYGEALNPLFPRHTSMNAIARFVPRPTIEVCSDSETALSDTETDLTVTPHESVASPKTPVLSSTRGPPRSLLIVSAHHDSAPEYWLRYRHPWLFTVSAVLSVTGITLSSLVGVAMAVAAVWFPALLGHIIASRAVLGLFLGALGSVTPLLFLFGGNRVPGAMDNLGGVAVLAGLGKCIKTYLEKSVETNLDRNNLEVRLVSFGSEECGLRGARAYFRSHHEEFDSIRASGGQVLMVNLDGVGSGSKTIILDRERTTRTSHSADLVSYFLDMGGSMEARSLGLLDGGTDAAVFSQGGVDAVTLLFIPDLYMGLPYYHTREDTPDKVSPDTLVRAAGVVARCIDDAANGLMFDD
ncbi:Peptidase family M28 [Carpediemonas membranifera]|uniref:Peptidase family M28 n=1 Tax=Carpediemonas membranifera TaxID=201153 RepID=A0A8J6B7P3_9EUKA|nr:Peptidase family M28 [Carpediemonas membranifera]|eukprot:KAG9394457.1 Peptidase family M28 [Carpediemonas membranifera]